MSRRAWGPNGRRSPLTTVVLFRAANVGGHQTFRPAALAREMSEFEVASVGAAGSFVVRGRTTRAVIGAAMARRLPFPPELLFCTARDLRDLVAADPLAAEAAAAGARRHVTLLARRSRTFPDLPWREPDEEAWQVLVGARHGPFVVSLWRRGGKKLLYPSVNLEKVLGVPATTRTWDTMGKLHALLPGR